MKFGGLGSHNWKPLFIKEGGFSFQNFSKKRGRQNFHIKEVEGGGGLSLTNLF